MEIESLEIFQYLTSCDPISKLDEEIQKKIALSIEIIYIKRNQIVLSPGDQNNWLYLVRSGALEKNKRNGELLARFAEGDYFGQAALRRNGRIERQVKAIEDTLLYRFPAELFFELLKTSPYFQFYFERGVDLSNAQINQSGPSTNLSHIKVESLLHEKPQMVDHKQSVVECAAIMQQTGSTSLLVTQNDQVKGIVTDRAFCTKIVADNLPHQTPVGLIMSDQLLTIDGQSTASEALLLMARYNIRHLPVLYEDEVLGVLTATDLIHRQSNNPIYLVNQIYKAPDVDKLVEYAKQIPKALVQQVQNGHNAKEIGYSISSIGRAINVQLLKLAEQKLGPPPVKYAWIVAGSLARNDQTAQSDQDNAIIIDERYDPLKHADYFERLSQFVCDGLNACGYVYCPGKVMAMTEKWRQPTSVWRKYFYQWVAEPKPKALMYASIFFDLRCIHGDNSLLLNLNQYVRQLIKDNEMFLNYMAANAVKKKPPLGLFRGFVLEKHGSEEKALNMKKRGITPITDLARVYALACGAHALNNLTRLNVACKEGELSKPGLMDLSDAYEFLSYTRISHQAKQIEQGQKPDNYVQPEELSSLERRHLKVTFEVIRTYQKALESSYQVGMMG